MPLRTTLGAVATKEGWEVKPRDQAVSPQETLPRNHGPVVFAISLATLGKPALRTIEPGWTSLVSLKGPGLRAATGATTAERNWSLETSLLNAFWKGWLQAAPAKGYHPHHTHYVAARVQPALRGGSVTDVSLCFQLFFC